MGAVTKTGRRISVLACACLVACATPQGGRTLHPQALFAADGRLSVVVTAAAADTPPRTTSGRFTWTERAERSEIALYSPLGETIAEIETGPVRSVMRTAGSVEEAPTPEALAARALGVDLPVSGLRAWLRGRTRDGAVRAPAAFDEDGWHVSYPQMQDDGVLPRIVKLERMLPERIEVRLVVDHWDGPEAARRP